MAGELDAGTDMGGVVDDGFVVDDTTGVEDGGILKRDMSANRCSCCNYDIFADTGVAGEDGGGVDGVDEIDAGGREAFGVLPAGDVVADGDDGAADALFAESRDEREVAEDFYAVTIGVFKAGVGIEKTRDVKLMVVAEDIQNNTTVTTSTNNNDFHEKLSSFKRAKLTIFE